MDTTKLIWFAGLFLASVTINSGLIKIITDDKLERPNLLSLFVNGILSIIGGFFAFVFLGWIYATLFISVNIFIFLAIVYITKRRTVNALELGEKLLVALKTADLQITYILNEIYSGQSQDLAKQITRALRFILSELPDILGLDNLHRPQLSVLVPINNKFKVVAYERIESFRIEKMEELFKYGPETVSLAGHAMNQRSPVIVNDLANESDKALRFWVKTSHDEAQEGSILAFPIIRGLGSLDKEPIAILCITSSKKNAFENSDPIVRVLTYFSLKIEILQNCMDLTKLKGV